MKVEASNGYPVHNLDTGLNYTTIQEAIHAAETLGGHTIFVEEGIYYEHLLINKSISLIGENKNNTTLDGEGVETIIKIEADNVTINNFSINNGYTGLSAYSVSNTTIQDNSINNNTYGISLSLAINSSSSRNSISHNEQGIYIYGGESHTIVNNTISHNEEGTHIIGGSNSYFANNTVKNNFLGLVVYTYGNCTIRGNLFNDNQHTIVSSHYLSLIIGVAKQDIDTSNKVNGKSIIYLVNQTDFIIDSSTYPDVGYLALLDCSNVTIGNLTLTNNGEGMLLQHCSYVTIKNCTLRNNLQGILSLASHNITIVGCNISENCYGITLIGDFNTIANNTITNNTLRHLPYRWPDGWLEDTAYIVQWLNNAPANWYSGGISLIFTSNNTISNNNVTSNDNGIMQSMSKYNAFSNNRMAGNVHNFGIDPQNLIPREWIFSYPDSPEIGYNLQHSIDESNTVDGKPIYYWISKHNQKIPSDAGYVALINCTDIILEDLVLTDNIQGAFLIWVNNTIVTNCTISRNTFGIDLRGHWGPSFNVTIDENFLSNNGFGIYCTYNSIDCIFENNILTSNLLGVSVEARDHNTISGNLIINHTLPPTSEWLLGKYPPHESIWWEKSWVSDFPLSYSTMGIYLDGENTTIVDNDLVNNNIGLKIGTSYYGQRSEHLSIVHGNNFTENFYGIITISLNNTISENRLTNNTEGMLLSQSSNNTISGNILENNFEAIGLLESSTNLFFGNTLVKNYFGFSASLSSGNNIFNNNFVKNTYQYVSDLTNVLDNGYPLGGNYWSNYSGIDLDYDGIGDSPFNLNINNIDDFPLMGMFSSFDSSGGEYVNVVSNSTIEDFTHFESNSTIKMHVSNMTGNQTHGFVRITIPHTLMTEPYNITVNGVNPTYWNYTLHDNGTHRWIYFAYEHSTLEIVIVPELSSLIILSLLMVAALPVAIVYRRKRIK